MADYGQFSLSGPFAALLNSVVVEEEGTSPSDATMLVLTCQQCGDSLCEVEPADTMDVLVQTVIEHQCPDIC